MWGRVPVVSMSLQWTGLHVLALMSLTKAEAVSSTSCTGRQPDRIGGSKVGILVHPTTARLLQRLANWEEWASSRRLRPDLGFLPRVTMRVTATAPASSLKALSTSTSHRRQFDRVAGLAPAPTTEVAVLACALSRCLIRPFLMAFGLTLPASPLEGAAILWHVRRQRSFCGRLTIRSQGNGHLAGDLQFA
jgi:hypothetical protein